MAGRENTTAIENWPTADVRKTRDGIDTSGTGEIVRPQRTPILDRQSVKLAGGISGNHNLAFDRRAGTAEEACRFWYGVVVPQAPPIVGGEHYEFVVDGDDENPPVRNRRPAAHGSGNGGLPDDPAIRRI